MEIVNKESVIRESGAKRSALQNITEDCLYDKKGNPLPLSVAMVAKCVAHYRKRMLPLKTIYLYAPYFYEFDCWVRNHATEQEGDSKINMYTFDGVEINLLEKGHVIRSRDGNDRFDYDFYPQGNA